MTKRNSSIELLRILAFFGISLMHTFKPFFYSATGTNALYGILVNSIFNSSVSIFFLISGYYGIKHSKEKIARYWFLLFFFSALWLISDILIYKTGIGAASALRFAFPLSAYRYFFMSVYILFIVFADYINRFVDSLSNKELKKLIIILSIIFCVIPTFTKIQFLGDMGKGIINMFIVYIIGVYLRRVKKDYSIKKLTVILLLSLSAELILNFIATKIGGSAGIHVPFAYDYSIFILINAICIFSIFKQKNFYSKPINWIASGIIIAYLIDPVLRNISTLMVNWPEFNELAILPLILVVTSLIMFIIAIIYNFIRNKLLIKIEDFVVKIIVKIIDWIEGKYNKFFKEEL